MIKLRLINLSCGEIKMVILFYGYIANGAKNLEPAR